MSDLEFSGCIFLFAALFLYVCKLGYLRQLINLQY